MSWDAVISFCIATGYLLVLAASLEQLLKIPDVHVLSGRGYEIKLNLTGKNPLPEEVSFVKLKSTPAQQDVDIFFLHYHKLFGPMSSNVQDPRISFIGNLSSGHVWFKFLDVHVNDSGTYGVLCKRPRNTDIFGYMFEVNVTQAPISAGISPTKAAGEVDPVYPRERQSSTTRKVLTKAKESAALSASTSRGTGFLVLLCIFVTRKLVEV